VQVSVTGWRKPLLLCAAAVLAKLALGLTDGLLALGARAGVPLVRPVARALHRLETRAHGAGARRKVELALTLAGLLLALGLVEGYLRLFPGTLPHALGNHVAFPYDARRNGIYRPDATMRMLAMRPHFERAMYFNGYRWHHRTDGMGFRNPVDRDRADIVLLGDSMIYGHGVEEPSTVRHHLERELGWPVANLGIQGASAHEEYQVLKRYGVALRPRYAFVFFLVNDIDDLAARLSPPERRRLLALPVGDHETPYFDVRPAPPRRFRLSHLWRDTYTYRAVEFALRRWRAPGVRAAAAAERPAWTDAPPFRGQPARRGAMRAHLRLLEKMQDLARVHRFRLVHLVFWSRTWPAEEAVYEAILEELCRRRGIPFYSLRRALEALPADADAFYLPGDGHLSDRGARWTAALVAGYVRSGRFEPDAALRAVTGGP
jgi:hypothetical protein